MIARALLSGMAAGLLAACSAGATTADDDAVIGAEAGVLTIEPSALSTRLEAGEAIQLIDVRTPEEFAQGHIAGAINVPLDEFDPAALPDPQGAERVLYCRSDRRSGIAAEKLADASGRNAVHLEGGILAWDAAGLPVIEE
ncbi:rhodanese-like domain-containing protein [Qipengyuania sp. XHP0207]|uniref:rhodanese-like domain-containing protein n=1 Tax=Qipengyuania sp. XHP0207 TaxID=3038078 RepID=UPI00241D0113|nr:rhodanese-like domain-containing protein [Qipengyuania sp. XHP0207]MDG5746675.1 rhodanese-like domain-containing protein [Qipengyuania sp. XHP0207]